MKGNGKGSIFFIFFMILENNRTFPIFIFMEKKILIRRKKKDFNIKSRILYKSPEYLFPCPKNIRDE